MLKIVNLCVTDKEKKKFLFLKRNKPPFKDYYGMMGGKVKEGENISDAASRELFEESEITSRGEYIGKCYEKIIENDNVIGEFDIHFFHFVVDENTNFNSSNEGEIKWIPIDEFEKTKLIPSDPLMINNYFNGGTKNVASVILKKGDEYIQEKFEERDKELIIFDEVYGKEIIKETVLIELINSKPVQRLKRVSQYGVPDEYYHKINYSRFDHSIGVLLLLRRLGADLDEQIAGLLHDVSHTAFSHVVDWAIGDSTKEDYQDINHSNIIKNSEIPEILTKYLINSEEISKIEEFSLLEKPAPSLCVDRIDYTLRELKKDGEEVDDYIKNLIVHDGQIVFKEKEVAKKFADSYLKLQNEHWAGSQAKIRYHILGSILKKALEKKIISLEDLYKTDKEIIDVLNSSSDDFIKDNLILLKGELEIKEVDSDSGVLIKKKFRYIDPEILINGEVKKVSEVFKDYEELLNNEKIKSNIQRRYVYNGICN